METIFQNKQIARFLGWEEQKNPQERFFGKFKKPNYGWIKENELGFNCCWNSLMEAVEYVENLGYEVYFYPSLIEIYDGGTSIVASYVETNLGVTKIEAVYQAVVEFIKWYNEQNK